MVAKIGNVFPGGSTEKYIRRAVDHVLYQLATFPELFPSVDDAIDHFEHCAIDVTREKNLYRTMTCWRCGGELRRMGGIGVTKRCPCTARSS